MSVESGSTTSGKPQLVDRLYIPPEEDHRLWCSSSPLREQLQSGEGEGFIMRVTDPQILASRLRMVTPGKMLVHEAIPLAMRAHAGQRRKDGKTPYIVHPLRTALRDTETHEVRDVELAIDVLHDTAEDCGMTRDMIINHFCNLYGHSINVAELIWHGISALSNREGGKELKESKYHNKIIRAHHAFPQLHIVDRKTGDRGDNFMDDLRFAIDHPDTPIAQRKISHYLPKASVALNFGKRFEPNSQNTRRLESQFELAIDILN